MIVTGHRVLGECAGLGRAGMNEQPLTPGQLRKGKQPVVSQLSNHKRQVLVKPEMNGNYENVHRTHRIIETDLLMVTQFLFSADG